MDPINWETTQSIALRNGDAFLLTSWILMLPEKEVRYNKLIPIKSKN